MQPVLVLLMPGFARDENDTTCIPFSQHFVRELNRQYPGVEIRIIAADYPYCSQPYTWHGNKVTPLNGNRYKAFRPLLWLRIYRELAKIRRQRRLLGILSFWCAENALAAHYFAQWNRVRHFIWLQGQDARKGNGALRFFTPPAQALLALSDFLRDEFHRNYGITPFRVIYPGVSNAPAVGEVVKRDIDIVGVGSLIPLKRYDSFLRVVARLKPAFPSLRVVLVGKGPEEEKLRRMILENDLVGTVSLAGELDHPAVLQLMRHAKVLLHPSAYEGYVMAGLEALQAGCRVVSFVSPEQRSISNWHVVNNEDEMTSVSAALLGSDCSNFVSFVPHRIQQTSAEIMGLYGINPPERVSAGDLLDGDDRPFVSVPVNHLQKSGLC